MVPVAIGFRVKSGWATSVLLAGPVATPVAVDRQTVALADPELPDSRQPYHAVLELPTVEGEMETARLVKDVERFSSQSFLVLIESYRKAGHRIRAVGIVVGSDADPTRIRNAHIRAHALEGRLFRRVIEEAARSHGLETTVTVEQRLQAAASRKLGLPEEDVRRVVATLGRALGAPFRAEEKAATLAAWMALA